MLVPILTLSLEVFIVSAQTEANATALFAQIRVIMLISCTSIFSVLAILYILRSFSILEISLRFIFLTVLATALSSVHAYYALVSSWLIRGERYNQLAIRGPLQNTVIGSAQLTLGSLGFKYLGLIVGELVGRIVSILILTRFIKKKSPQIKQLTVTKLDKWELRKYPFRGNFLGTLLDNACSSSLMIFIGFKFGDEAAGHLGFAQRIMLIPVTILGLALSQYLFASASSIWRHTGLLTRQSINRIYLQLSLLAIAVCIFMYFIAPFLINTLYGVKWVESSNLIVALIPLVFLGITWGPLSSLFYSMNLYWLFMKVSLARLLIISASILISDLFDMTLTSTILAILISGSVVQFYGLFIVRSKSIK